MKLAFPRPQFLAVALTLATSIFSVSTQPVAAQTAQVKATKPAIATTLGYGADQVLNFTYTQNFDCIDQPNSDLNFNGVVAANDPNEMQIPICQVGTQPSINPPGQKGNPQITTEPIFVLVPMFSTNNDQNPNDAISCDNVVPNTTCGAVLGNTLISLFGNVPEAFKAAPAVYTQCPEPGAAPGTCTMHASRLDLGPALEALGLVPPPLTNIFLPTPNHSHVLIKQDINLPSIWWQVIPVLVFDQSLWPPKDGSSGLTSFEAVEAAVKAGTAVQVPSNFFLYFASKPLSGSAHQHMQ
jgi:hypothetical protein